MTATGVQWQGRAARLADELAAAGWVSDPAWRAAFAAVPAIDGEVILAGEVQDQRARWLDAVHSDDALLTQSIGSRPTSSSSRPRVMAVMLELLDVATGARMLEIGTGTGYNAALLTERLGSEPSSSPRGGDRGADRAGEGGRRRGKPGRASRRRSTTTSWRSSTPWRPTSQPCASRATTSWRRMPANWWGSCAGTCPPTGPCATTSGPSFARLVEPTPRREDRRDVGRPRRRSGDKDEVHGRSRFTGVPGVSAGPGALPRGWCPGRSRGYCRS